MESCTKAARWRLAATRRASRHEVFLNFAISVATGRMVEIPKDGKSGSYLNFELSEFSFRISDMLRNEGN
jgi:hypothetical protein